MDEGERTAHTGRDFEIVRASQEHLDLVVPLFDGYRRFYGQHRDPEGAHGFLLERMARGESVLFLAVRGADGLGFTQLYPSFSSVSMKRLWILNDLFVAPEARRRGVAVALLEEARGLAVETRSRGLELATATDNLSAQRLYEGLGWKRDDAFHHYSLSV
jgi:GNAT superfamily N-acetyltransferase